MAKKKKDKESGPFNPYFGKTKDDSNMPEKPFFLWLLALPGAGLGLAIGIRLQEPVLGTVFGAVMGMAVGSMIDKLREKHGK